MAASGENSSASRSTSNKKVRVTGPTSSFDLSQLGPIYIAANGKDISLALAKTLLDRLVAKGARQANTLDEARIICFSETLSIDAIRSILRRGKVRIESGTTGDAAQLILTSLRWVRSVLATSEAASPSANEFLCNGIDLQARILEEQARDSKRPDTATLIPAEFPKEYASGARSLLGLIEEEDMTTDEGLKRVPAKYRDKVASLAQLPSVND